MIRFELTIMYETTLGISSQSFIYNTFRGALNKATYYKNLLNKDYKVNEILIALFDDTNKEAYQYIYNKKFK